MACKWYSVCPLRQWEHKKKISEHWKLEFCSTDANWNTCHRYRLEEQGIPHDKILPDGSKLEISPKQD